MSRDQDPHQRLWLSLGHGGKTAPVGTWRYWKKPGQDRTWVIAAPNNLAQFEQRDKAVFYNGTEILTAPTQWQATWRAVAYFYAEVVPSLPKPPVAGRQGGGL